ncbi:hypothetical protein GCM10020220_079090 [Nonomuraea rubra]
MAAPARTPAAEALTTWSTHVVHVARHVHPGHGGLAHGVGGQVRADDEPVHLLLGGLQPESVEAVEPGVQAGADGQRLPGHLPAAGQPYAGEAVAGHHDPGQLALDHGDPPGGELLAGLLPRLGRCVQEEDHVVAPLPPQQGLVHGQRAGGHDADGLVADLPAVAVRAVQHLAAPPPGQPRHRRQLVDQAGGHQQPGRLHRGAVRQDDAGSARRRAAPPR